MNSQIQKSVDHSIGEGSLLKFKQTSENYLEVSVGGNVYNF